MSILRREREILQSLLDCINEESRALRENDIAALENAAHHKDQRINSLNQQEELRRSLLLDAGFAPESLHFERFLSECDPAHRRPLQDAWDAIQLLSVQCHQANMRNGQLNAIAQRMVRQMLSLLRGESTFSEVYDRGGLVATPDSKALGRV